LTAPAATTLCIDTCGPSLLLAVGQRVDQLSVHYEAMATGQAEAIIPALGAIMEDSAAKGFAPISQIAVTVGPGSFTGLRVGLAVAKARAVAGRASLVPVNRMEMLARCWQLEHVQPSAGIVSLDARRGERFMQAFDAQLAAVTAAVTVRNEDVAAWRIQHEARFGAGYYLESQDVFAPTLAAQALFVCGQTGGPISHQDIQPLYVRPPDAKRPKATRFRVS
jgi:tRNA threonylcarbamoyladenosine biosynthesis protein TsaB